MSEAGVLFTWIHLEGDEAPVGVAATRQEVCDLADASVRRDIRWVTFPSPDSGEVSVLAARIVCVGP